MENITDVSMLWTCPPQRLRTLEDDRKFRCKLCSRHLNVDDVHWVCMFCRVNNPCGKCPSHCDACFMMSIPKFQPPVIKQKVSKKPPGKYAKKGTGNVYGKKKIRRPSLTNTSSSSSGISSSLAKDSTVPQELTSLQQTVDLQIYTKSPHGRMNLPDTMKFKNNPRFLKRMKELEPLLFGELEPTIPEYLLSPDLKLPPVPQQLADEYMTIRDELVRLLATSSICCHLSDNLKNQQDDSDPVDDINTDGFTNMFMGVIMFKANDFADIIFEIRKSLLLKVTCKDTNIMPLLVRGAIEPSLSFFGNIRRLMSAVQKDPNNVLTKKK